MTLRGRSDANNGSRCRANITRYRSPTFRSVSLPTPRFSQITHADIRGLDAGKVQRVEAIADSRETEEALPVIPSPLALIISSREPMKANAQSAEREAE